MSGFNNYEEDDQVPGLLPLKKKHETSVVTPSDKNNKSTDTLNNIIKDSIQKTPVSVQGKDNQKSFGQFKKGPQKEPVQQMDKKTKDKKQSAKKDNQFNKLENEKTKQNEKMKTLIAQMLNSMTTKNNATEELYPVSNQIIEELMSKIDEQIAELNNEADRKSANQNNLHAEKELEVIRRQINHCGLIKELYYEKMNYRNKIQSLEEEIINLRSENRDLKLKVSRGIQSIENYKHNLPCDREKQLIQKLSICTQDLAQQKEMRQNLEKNIEGIIMNFKKLYDQADAARKIVTQKLKQVQERQRKLRKQKQSDHDYSNYVKSQKKIASPDLSQQRKQNDSRFAREESNDNQISTRREYDDNQNDRSAFRPKPLLIMTQPAQQRFKQKINEKQKEKSKQKQRQRQKKQKQKQKQKQKKLSQSQNEALTLEEKIKRMRNNQINFKKNFAN